MLMILSYFKLKDRIKEYGFNDKQAQYTVSRLRRMDKQIKKSFGIWFTKGDLPEYSIENFTVADLINEVKMNPINAFLTLDWLKKEPDTAKKSLLLLKDRVLNSECGDKAADKYKKAPATDLEEDINDLEIDTDDTDND